MAFSAAVASRCKVCGALSLLAELLAVAYGAGAGGELSGEGKKLARTSNPSEDLDAAPGDRTPYPLGLHHGGHPRVSLRLRLCKTTLRGAQQDQA